MDATGDAGHNRSPEEVSRRYTVYLIVVALAGWSLASYDLNLLVLTIPDIASELKLSSSLVGSLVFFVSAAQFVDAGAAPHPTRPGIGRDSNLERDRTGPHRVVACPEIGTT